MHILTSHRKMFKKGDKSMEKKNSKVNNADKNSLNGYRKDAPGAISGINTPGIELPAYNPPVPNRAWTAMKAGRDIEELTDEEREELYIGYDRYF